MNTQEETRNGFTITAEMKQVWEIQILMFTKLLDVCIQNGLEIWGCGGTLLGAVREHGYIPWDDDMDYYMFRKDYEKLLAIGQEEFPAPFHLQSARSDKNYFRGHAQLRYDGTSAILPNDIWQSFHQGIFIDIFVLDGIPDNDCEKFKAELYNAYDIQEKLFTSSYWKWNLTHPRLWGRTVFDMIFCLIKGKRRLFEEYENTCKRYDIENCQYVACTVYDHPSDKWFCFKKEWFSGTEMMPFENFLIPVPSGYKEMLTFQYGADYMTPRQAPALHGGFAVLDAGTDYKESLKKLRKEKRIESIRKICHLK